MKKLTPKKALFDLGIRSTLKGFHYLKYGLELCMEDEDLLLMVYKNLYPLVAEKYGTSVDCVEKCIRTATDACWYRGNRRLLFEMASYEMPQKPKNAEFFDIVYHYIEEVNS